MYAHRVRFTYIKGRGSMHMLPRPVNKQAAMRGGQKEGYYGGTGYKYWF